MGAIKFLRKCNKSVCHSVVIQIFKFSTKDISLLCYVSFECNL